MSVAICLASGSAMIPNPSRQPVIAYVLEKPSTVTVRSNMSGRDANEVNPPS